MLFSTFAYPHFGLCANVDLAAFYPFVKQQGYSFTVALVYAISRAANAIPEFRLRIRAGQVVEHEIVNPGFTLLVEEDLFRFCTVEYVEDFPEFAARAGKRMAYAKTHPGLDTDPGADDMLYMSPVPWVSFTSVLHPLPLHPADSIPRFAWGKYFKESDTLKMPLGVQGHHAVMDGIHMGRFYERVQEYLYQPEVVLGGVTSRARPACP
jgi:chloramphenicol O-acetyltransferase type A